MISKLAEPNSRSTATLRAILTCIGSVLATRGLMEESDVEAAVGAFAVLIPWAHSIWLKSRARAAATPPADSPAP